MSDAAKSAAEKPTPDTSNPAPPIVTPPSPESTSSPAVPASPAETVRPEVAASPEVPSDSSSSVQNAAQSALQQSLSRANFETEVSQVMGSFNSWWGGVKKQSQSAFSIIKADIDKTVTQAQADLESLRTAKVEIVRKEAEPTQDIKGKGKAKEEPEAETETEAQSASTTATSLLDRLTSSTNQLQHSLQSTFQSTLASAANNPALSNPTQLRAQLAENLRLSSAKENLQLSVKQAEKMAEEYLRKGDQWVKDAEKWMGDAVKVVPPEDGETQYIAMGDAGDFYSFSTSTSSKPKEKVLFDAENKAPRSSPAVIAGSRKDALLQRLREDEKLLMVDPEGDDESEERREQFKAWVKEAWPDKVKDEKEKEIGNVGEIRMALVPEHLTDDQFWQRYLFHKHMIAAEDEKRKKLLEATRQEQPDDFSWDDETEESPVAAAPAEAKQSSPVKTTPAPAGPLGKVSAQTSPRDSEESYDLVSDQGPKAAEKKPASKDTDDDEDSDWE